MDERLSFRDAFAVQFDSTDKANSAMTPNSLTESSDRARSGLTIRREAEDDAVDWLAAFCGDYSTRGRSAAVNVKMSARPVLR